MADKVTYDTELMNKISVKYNDGYKKVDDAINEFEEFANSFLKYYKGQADVEIFASIMDTLKKHLEILKLCYSNMEEYVTSSKDEMVAADESLSKSISSGNSLNNNGGAK